MLQSTSKTDVEQQENKQQEVVLISNSDDNDNDNGNDNDNDSSDDDEDDDDDSSRIGQSISNTNNEDAKQQQQQQQPHTQSKLIGGKYTEHEFRFVVTAGVVLSFNGGYINGSCLSGLLTDSMVQQSVAGFTGSYTKSALFLADGQINDFGFQVCMILSFILGSCISGIITPDPTPFRIEPTYGPSFILGGIFLSISSILSATGEDKFFFYWAAAANGIQNGMTSMYSANLIRSTHFTGNSTDIGLFIGQMICKNQKNRWKLNVLIALTGAFWIGGLVSFYATSYFTSLSLLFNAGLFFLVGANLIYFLVHELHVSVMAAMTGKWLWQNVFDEIEELLYDSLQHGEDITKSEYLQQSSHFAYYFDSLFNKESSSLVENQLDGVGEEELTKGLEEAGITQLSKKEIRVLLRKADKDKTGKMSKEDFIKIAKKAMKRRQKQNSKISLSSFVEGKEGS